MVDSEICEPGHGGMRIRWKMVAVVLPVFVITISLATLSSVLSATTAVSRVTQRLLNLKANELYKHADGQWRLLLENGLATDPAMIAAVQSAVLLYARGLLETEDEIVVAVDSNGDISGSTSFLAATDASRAQFADLHRRRETAMITLNLDGISWVAKGFYFAPFDWFYLLAVPRAEYYEDIDQIIRESIVILIVALAATITFLLLLSQRLTRPLGTVAASMQRIIDSFQLNERVPVEFPDETGDLAHTFNRMISELEHAYSQIKRYAFGAVLARKRETKIRTIFQKYVPQDLIDRFCESPDSMLVGENRELVILFSDIRSFTTISERMRPDDLVNSLNRYFGRMVDVIMARDGVVDKYIGDAIMAFFGAPVHRGDEPLQAVSAAIEMTEALASFNADQRASGAPEFRTGIGLNFGEVTVGNIGTDRKMDYTVIGDAVNLASRLEGLTKKYGEPLIYSEALHPHVRDTFPCRLIDAVAVQGRTEGVRIYTSRRSIDETTARAWQVHNGAMEAYFNRDFAAAAGGFLDVNALLPHDPIAAMLLSRTRRYQANPPGPEWTGVEVMTSK